MLYRRVVLLALVVKGCIMKRPKQATDGRPTGPGYGSDAQPVARDSTAANAADDAGASGASTRLDPDDSSKDASGADGDEETAGAVAGDGSPICCDST